MLLMLGSVVLGVSALVDDWKGVVVGPTGVKVAAGVNVGGWSLVAFLLVLSVVLGVIAPLGIILLGFDIPLAPGSLNSLRINRVVLGHLPLGILLADRTAHYFVIYLNIKNRC